MDLWLILNKLILLLFLIFYFIKSDLESISWIVLFLLLYLCLNISGHLFKTGLLKKLMALAAVMIILLSSISIHPLLLILLPISLLELFTPVLGNWPLLLVQLVPFLWMQNSIQPIYLLSAALSSLTFFMANNYSSRLVKMAEQNDKMRKEIQSLSRSLNENTEYVKQLEYNFKLEERNRLSQEIHDKIGHSMTGALIQMEASKHLLELDQHKARELLQNAIQISKEGIESIRMTLKNMKPPAEQVGLSRVRLFADEFSAKNDLKVTFLPKGNMDRISPLQWKIIYENVTEALTNTLRYSEAAKVSIEIHVLNKLIKAEIKDDGKGAMKIAKGLGLMGMEERTASVNGTIIFDGKNGFTVTMLLPILES